MRDQAGAAPGWADAPEVPRSLDCRRKSKCQWCPFGSFRQPRRSFGIPSNIPWLSWELREQGAGKDGGFTPSPTPSSVPRSSSASWITTSVKNLKSSSSSQLGVAAPGPGLAVPRGMAAGGSGKREPEGLDALSTSALLLVPFAAWWSSSLAVPHGSALVWAQPCPRPGTPAWIPQEPSRPARGLGSGWDPPCSRREW